MRIKSETSEYYIKTPNTLKYWGQSDLIIVLKPQHLLLKVSIITLVTKEIGNYVDFIAQLGSFLCELLSLAVKGASYAYYCF